MRECKNLCSRLPKVSIIIGNKIYQEGVKFCKTCDLFLKIEGYRCLCCRSAVRSRSHNRRWRNRRYVE